jgi:hypothetical protein
MERIQLEQQVGVDRVLAWQCAPPESSRCKTISIGALADGRWWAWHTGIPGGAFLAGDWGVADELAAGWREDGREWVLVPAVFGPDGLPVEAGWVKRGGSWFRE